MVVVATAGKSRPCKRQPVQLRLSQTKAKGEAPKPPTDSTEENRRRKYLEKRPSPLQLSAQSNPLMEALTGGPREQKRRRPRQARASTGQQCSTRDSGFDEKYARSEARRHAKLEWRVQVAPFGLLSGPSSTPHHFWLLRYLPPIPFHSNPLRSYR